MDLQIEGYLLEALDGVDLLELVAQDPDLNSIVQDLLQDIYSRRGNSSSVLANIRSGISRFEQFY